MSGSKVPLACAWHKEKFYTAGPMPQNGGGGGGGLADGKYWVSMPLIPCIWTLYNRIFNATNQLVTCIIYKKCTLHHG